VGVAVGLALGTLLSEDLALLSAGALAQQGHIGLVSAIAACVVGIFLGDCGLWLLGRVGGHAAFKWPALARALQSTPAGDAIRRLDRHVAAAILASRFLPGTRLPLYVTAGVLKISGRRFALWALVAALLWTPPFVLASAWLGAALDARLSLGAGAGVVVAALLAIALTRFARRVAAPEGGERLRARLARWRQWEFWPAWLFYAPVAAWVAWLALRYRGFGGISAANPGIQDGGIVGESKAAILGRLPAEWTIPWAVIEPGDAGTRLASVLDVAARQGWTFPLVLKPDVGQRGAGVRLVRDGAAAARALADAPGRLLMQPYHEGPFEAGVFYYRFPGEPRGRILSITDKVFPEVVGDGRSTLASLIRTHARYRLQAHLFLARHATEAGRVLAPGERFRLAVAGNHAQGTIFRDGAHLWTPALERRIDDIARAFPGFYIGRFDIRYRSREAFMAGTDLAIVELNGATAESTNIYDPDSSLAAAYRQLFHQWALVFRIGAANRARGAQVTSTRRLAALVRAHLTGPEPAAAD
jgi:membrane protein DedA with SNARE-associated domain